MPGITRVLASGCSWLAGRRLDLELDKSRPSLAKPPNKKTPAPKTTNRLVW